MTAIIDAATLATRVEAAHPGAVAGSAAGELRLDRDHLIAALRFLRDDPDADLVFLANLTAVDQETHFDLDSWGGWIWPYRTVKPGPEPVNLTVTVRNPYPRGATLEVKLEGPEGWSGTGATLSAGPREEVSCQLQITPAGACRRQPVAVDLVADGRPFGQVAEALVTVGGDRF